MKKLKKIFIILLIVAILVMIFVLYKLYKSSNYSNQKQDLINTTTPTSTLNKVEVKTFNDKNDFYEISANYPKDTRDKDNTIEDFVLYNIKNIQTEWKVGGDIYNSEQQLNKDFPDRVKTTYTYNIDYKTKETTNQKITTYILTDSQDTGGAHPNYGVNTFTFSDNGKLNIEDIIDLSNGNGVKLSQIIADKLLSRNDGLINKDMLLDGLGITYLKSDGTIDKEKCHCDGFYIGSNFQKFYITDGGITFLFDPYQIAPYAAGVVEVPFTFEELSPYLIDKQIINLARS